MNRRYLVCRTGFGALTPFKVVADHVNYQLLATCSVYIGFLT